MPQNLTDDKSTLVQAWCHQAITSHYLNHCWPRSPTPYGVTRPQWVKIITTSPRGQWVNTADCKWVWQQHLCGCHGDLMLSASGPPSSTRKAAMNWLLHIPKCMTRHGIPMLQNKRCENVKQSLGRGRGRMGGCWQQPDLKLCVKQLHSPKPGGCKIVSGVRDSKMTSVTCATDQSDNGLRGDNSGNGF